MAILTAKTKYGAVAGVPAGNPEHTIFKGVPYAKPPVGPLRFQPPQEPDPWSGERSCAQWPAPALQKKMGPDGEWFGSEDCLYVNIWTPAKTPDAGLPVIFWIHGGGWLGGASHGPTLDGEAYNKRGVILVSVGYRLGALGFLGLEAWRKKDPHRSTGNFGMMDIIAALKWTKENVAAFGGDPGNITIAGQSSGGMSVKWLVGCKPAEGLFQHGIAQSGGGTWDIDPILPVEEKCSYSQRILDSLGWTEEDLFTRSALEVSRETDKVVPQLGLPKKSFIPSLFQPSIDGYLVTDYYGANIYRGETFDVDLMCGTLREEWHNFICQIPNWQNAYTTEFALAPCAAWAVRQLELGKKPVYHYFFDHDLPPEHEAPRHASELQYTFGCLDAVDRPWEAYDREISETAVDYWCAFAKNGNPAVEGRPAWPAFTKEHPVTMHFANDGIRAEDLSSGESIRKVIRYLLEEPGLVSRDFDF